jgi:hypothetical protein
MSSPSSQPSWYKTNFSTDPVSAYVSPDFDQLRSFHTNPSPWAPTGSDAKAMRDKYYKNYSSKPPKQSKETSNESYFLDHDMVAKKRGQFKVEEVEEEEEEEPIARTFSSEMLKWFFLMAILLITVVGMNSLFAAGTVELVLIGFGCSCVARLWWFETVAYWEVRRLVLRLIFRKEDYPVKIWNEGL